jgi:hypothetical protein
MLRTKLRLPLEADGKPLTGIPTSEECFGIISDTVSSQSKEDALYVGSEWRKRIRTLRHRSRRAILTTSTRPPTTRTADSKLMLEPFECSSPISCAVNTAPNGAWNWFMSVAPPEAPALIAECVKTERSLVKASRFLWYSGESI